VNNGADKLLPEECCAKCRFPSGAVGAEGAELVCRRFPPVAQMVMVPVPRSVRNPEGGMGQAIGSMWPPVQPAQWCGEYQGKPAGKLAGT